MLSWKSGIRLARVLGGKDEGKILHLKEEPALKVVEPEEEEEEYYDDYLNDSDFTIPPGSNRLINPVDYRFLMTCLKRKNRPLNQGLGDVYQHLNNQVSKLSGKVVNIPDGTFSVIPAENTERVVCAAMSGCGKSTWARKYMLEYLLEFPDRRIFLISPRNEDPAYKGIPYTFIPTTDVMKVDEEDFNEEGKAVSLITIKKLAESLVVFDDCDNLANADEMKAAIRLANDVAANGRKLFIHTMFLCHKIMDGKKTSVLLNEANRVVFFLNGTTRQTDEFLKKHASFEVKMRKKIIALNSRWAMVSMGCPMYVIHEHGCFLLK